MCEWWKGQSYRHRIHWSGESDRTGLDRFKMERTMRECGRDMAPEIEFIGVVS